MATRQLTHSNNLRAEFVNISEQLSELLLERGVVTAPYESADLPLFSRLDFKSQMKVIGNIKSEVEVYASMRGLKERLNQEFLSRKQRHLGIKFSDGVWNRLDGPQTIIESYSLKHEFLFGNPRFYQASGYSAELVQCEKWMHLYSRPDDAAQALKELPMRSWLLFGATVDLDLEPYRVDFMLDPSRQPAMLKHKSVALFKTGIMPKGIIFIGESTPFNGPFDPVLTSPIAQRPQLRVL